MLIQNGNSQRVVKSAMKSFFVDYAGMAIQLKGITMKKKPKLTVTEADIIDEEEVWNII